jgi:hypothetical protein
MPAFYKKHPLSFFIFIIVAFYVLLDFSLGIFIIPRNYNSFRTLHPYYHHGLLPDQNTLAAWGPIVYPFCTNSLGFRDSSVYKVSEVSKHKRILFLGDSHTEAVGIPFQQSFFGILQKEALKKDIDLLNGSAVSYSPKIHFLKAKYLIENKKLKVNEIWCFIDISDLQNELAYEKFQPSYPSLFQESKDGWLRFLKTHSITYYTISNIIDKRKFDAFSSAVDAFNQEKENSPFNNTVELYSVFFKDFSDKEMLRNPEFHGVSQWIYDSSFIKIADKGLQLGMDNISRLNELCKRYNITLKLSVHPWQLQVMKQDTCNYYVKRWKDYCRNNHIDFINLFPVFINGENPVTVTRRDYIPNDNHWSESGHLRVAHFLGKYIN